MGSVYPDIDNYMSLGTYQQMTTPIAIIFLKIILTMTMTMTIVMTMNIYINAENTRLLAQELNKSGLINKLLAEHYAGNGPLIPEKKLSDLPDGKIIFASTPKGKNKFKDLIETIPPKDKTPDTEVKSLDDGFAEAGKRVAGYLCCTKAKPCQHWQWDTDNAQWVNSLTNETREA